MREQNGKKESDISEEYAKPRRGKTFLRLLVRFGILVATVALVLGAVYLVAHRDTLNLDTLRRAFSYSGVEKDANGQTEHFRYDGDPGNSFATLDGGLLVCSNHSIQLFDKSGTLTVDQAVNLEQPVVAELFGPFQCIPIADDCAVRRLGLFWRKGRRLTPVMEDFRAFLGELYPLDLQDQKQS